MPHEPFTLGSFEIVPLCDGWAPLPLDDEAPGHDVDWEDSFIPLPRGVPAGRHGELGVARPRVSDPSPRGAVLVDTGIGGFGRPPYDVVGRLDAELARRNASEEVRHVILTHLHADHAGATSFADGGPRFPNARYHVHPDDWDVLRRASEVRRLHRPVRDGRSSGAGPARPRPLGSRDVLPVSLRHAPGHTPGHRVVRVETTGTPCSGGGPAPYATPGLASDLAIEPRRGPGLAAQQRAIWVERARRERWTVCVSHFAHPFGHVRDEGWASHSGAHAPTASARVRSEERGLAGGRPRITPPSP